MGLGASAIAFIIWFLFFSVDEYKYFWAFLAILQFFVGYLMYRFAYSYIYDE
ncbi:membrane protein [Erwinia typographi]|uniref:Membrane protein n=1 Tax=Erwinia typographi TaxID=371042 RepID=A0A0A3ZCY0_9GAMM|nr:membrane protein [Erwinia typographi]